MLSISLRILNMGSSQSGRKCNGTKRVFYCLCWTLTNSHLKIWNFFMITFVILPALSPLLVFSRQVWSELGRCDFLRSNNPFFQMSLHAWMDSHTSFTNSQMVKVAVSFFKRLWGWNYVNRLGKIALKCVRKFEEVKIKVILKGI